MRPGVRRPDTPASFRPRKYRKRAQTLRRIAWLSVVAVLALVVVLVLRARAQHTVDAQPPLAAPIIRHEANAVVRRGALWSADAKQKLRTTAANTFGDPAFPAQTGVFIESARDGTVLYSHGATLSLTPASALKLVIAATALRDLGPGYRFTTRIVAGAAPHDGIVYGSVWLVGSGDPELTSHDLRAAVSAMHGAGVTRIAGDVIADGSLFGPGSVDPTWEADDLEYGYAAPASAVTLDGGTAQFTITPDASGGEADVRVDPAGVAGIILGSVRTVSADGDNTLRIDPLPDGTGFQVAGDIPYGAPQLYWRSLAHPEESAAVALRGMFLAGGIAVDGQVSVGTAPAGAVALWSKQSRPLSRIIKRMAFDSDNHIAEQLVRVVGAHGAGTGTLATGVARERKFLTAIGVSTDGIVLDDASGLSAGDRITARALAAVLRRLATDPRAPSITDLLARVGVEGTVRVRDLAPQALGRVLGKDGYIGAVSSLAGYVLTRYHGVVIYAIVVNNWTGDLDPIWVSEDDLLSKISQM